MSLKLLFVDDHEIVRHGLPALLADSEIEVVSVLEDGSQVVQQSAVHRPDVVLMDVRMNSVDGLAALDLLRQAHPEIPVVLFTSYDNPTYIARAVALGAREFVLKSDPCDKLIAAIRRAAAGETSPEGTLLQKTREAMEGSVKENSDTVNLPLTNREMQVLRHIALGLSNREISQSLTISVETVKEHVQNILRKISASDRTDAAVRAVKLGIV